MADDKARREIRIPVPDLDDIKRKATEAGEAAKAFNASPPQWAYWVFGIAIILLFLFIRTIAH